MTADPPRLEVSGLSVTFGGLTALTDVSFTVRNAEIVALIGPNGAGKTTVFNAICGLVRPSGGSVRIAGQPAPTSPTGLAGRGVARTLQGLGLFGGMTVRENVLVPIDSSARRSDGDANAVVEQILEGHGLLDVANHLVDTLSYPDRKRVALARALVTEPSLILLDEPAGGLGSDDIDRLAKTVLDLSAGGCAVLVVEHHVDFVMDVADRIVVLDFGQVIATGTPGQIRHDPVVEAAYLGMAAAP